MGVEENGLEGRVIKQTCSVVLDPHLHPLRLLQKLNGTPTSSIPPES